MAFNNASLGHVHAMAHQLGGFYDLPHGECNAILLPHVEKFNLIARVERFAEMATWMGENISGISPRAAAEKCLDAIRELSADVGIPSGLVELGKRYGKEVKEEDIAIMTANAQKDACGLTNPRCPKDSDVMAIYKAAM
jgi:alcohol dehydrogenase